MIELLAVLSVSAAAGMRIALPLLIIGLLYGDRLWSDVPLLSHIHPPIVLGVLVSWSLLELFASTKLMGQRILQVVQLIFSPIVGTIMGMAVAKAMSVPSQMVGILGGIGGLLALVFQLVQAGWFYRLRGLPLWLLFLEDVLCIILVFLALDAPREGGLIALLLLWFAIRSSTEWRKWYLAQRSSGSRQHPRRYQQGPD